MSKSKQTGDADEAPLASNKMTMSQQLMVVFLIITVGVLFGMGPVFALIFAGGGRAPAFADISSEDAQRFRSIEERHNRILGRPSTQPEDGPNPLRPWAISLWQANIAEADGLLPKGDALDIAVAEHLEQEYFLVNGRRRPVMDRDGNFITYGEALASYTGREKLLKNELERLVQVEVASEALYTSFGPAAPTPRAAAERRLEMADRVAVTKVVLDTAAMIDAFRAEAEADEVGLLDAYDQFKDRYFRIPPQRQITALVVDPTLIAAVVEPTLAELEAWYQANRSGRNEWQVAVAEDGTVEWQPLADVVDVVRAEVAQEVAVTLTQPLFGALMAALETAAIDGGTSPDQFSLDELTKIAASVSIGPDDDPRLTEAVSPRIVTDVAVSEPYDGDESVPVAQIGRLAAASARSFFSAGVAEGSLQLVEDAITDQPGMDMVVRIDASIAASSQDFEDAGVQAALITWLAGQKAYPALLEQANVIRTSAGELGEDGLATYFSDAAIREHWDLPAVPEPAAEDEPAVVDPAIDRASEGALAQVVAPPELPLLAGERPPFSATTERWLALVPEGSPVVVTAGTTPRSPSVPPDLATELPRVVLVQVTGHEPFTVPELDLPPEVLESMGELPDQREVMLEQARNQMAQIVDELHLTDYYRQLQTRVEQ